MSTRSTRSRDGARRPRLVALLVVLALAGAGPAAAYEVTSVADAGTLMGVVRFAGVPPRLAPLAVTRSREVCGERTEREALVVGPDRGVRDSVILIAGVARGKKPAAEVVLDQRDCRFVHHVTAAAPGDRVRVKNSDGILHSAHGFLGTTVFNVALPEREQTIDISRRLGTPGVVRVVCDAHPHMTAWMIVHDSPYYAVTDARGAFRIEGIPPGRYTVSLWHAGFRPRGLDRDGRPRYDDPRTVRRDVTIAPGATATLDFELK